jgi:hypothetical protein
MGDWIVSERTLPVVESSINGRTCLIGCLALAGIFAVVVAGGFMGLYVMARSAVQSVTEETPRALPPVTLSPEQTAETRARAEAFLAAVETGSGPASLTLTAEEMNALMREAGDEGPGAWISVGIEGDQLYGELSLPLHALGTDAFGLSNRHLNGRAVLDLRVEEGRLAIYMQSLEVKGKPVPEDFMTGLRAQNLTLHLPGMPELATLLGQLERIEVKDGAITVVRKAAALV